LCYLENDDAPTLRNREATLIGLQRKETRKVFLVLVEKKLFFEDDILNTLNATSIRKTHIFLQV